MITPSPTIKIDAGLARGTLISVAPGHFVFGVPNTNYEMHLVPISPITVQPGKRLIGKISLQARRVDVVGTGGEYVEPVYGRPRRVQGTVIRSEAGVLVVDAGVPIHVTLTDARQNVSDFQVGQVVSFDAVAGATFTLA